MAEPLDIQFVSLSAAPAGAVVLMAGPELALGPTTRGIDERMKGGLLKAARAAGFQGKAKTSIEILAPAGVDAARIILVGTGAGGKELDRLQLGGAMFAQLSARKGELGTIVADPADAGEAGVDTFAADLAFGAVLRSYAFKKYQTRKPDAEGEETPRDGLQKLVIQCAKPDAAAKIFTARKAVADGVFLARDLVNEPANILGPVEFAGRLQELTSAGLEVEILDEDQMRSLKMGALLAVGQGSERPSRVAIM